MMLSKLKQAKHQQHLALLPKLSQSVADVTTLFKTENFRHELLDQIAQAKRHIYITALYLEHDDAGRDILQALYQAKRIRPELDIKFWSIGTERNAEELELKQMLPMQIGIMM